VLTRRRLLAFIAVVAAVLATTTAVWAKGADQVTLNDGTTKVVLNDFVPDQTGMYELLWEGSGSVSGPPEADLGPMIEAVWRFPMGSDEFMGFDEFFFVRQLLYPLAAGGPVTYIEPGQLLYGEPRSGGWFAAPVGLVDSLRQAGFDLGATAVVPPLLTPAEVPSPVGIALEKSTRNRSTPWVIVLGAVLLAFIAVMRMEITAGKPTPATAPMHR